MVPQPEETMPGHTHYMTMLRGALQVRVGDCVYLMRDTPERWQPDGTPVRIPYDQVESTPDPAKMDIFRVEQLWRNEKWVMVTVDGYRLQSMVMCYS